MGDTLVTRSYCDFAHAVNLCLFSNAFGGGFLSSFSFVYSYNAKFFLRRYMGTLVTWCSQVRGQSDTLPLLLRQAFTSLFPLLLACRTFTPVYCPSPLSGITPLLYVAQTRQSNILKILLQYGILEREKNPINIVLTILLYPSRVRIMVDHELIDIQEDAKTCLTLCSRVLSVISVREIEVSTTLPFPGGGEWGEGGDNQRSRATLLGVKRSCVPWGKSSIALWGAIYHQWVL